MHGTFPVNSGARRIHGVVLLLRFNLSDVHILCTAAYRACLMSGCVSGGG